MKKLILFSLLMLGLTPALQAQFIFSVQRPVVASVGTTIAFLKQWEAGSPYENTGTGTTKYVSYVLANGNTYILDVSTPTCNADGATSGPTGTGTLIPDGTCVWNFVVAGSNFKVPGNYLATTSVEAIGGGGGGDNGGNTNACGASVPTNCGGGGGGGGYSKITSFTTAPNATIQYQAGLGGNPGAAANTISTPSYGTDGQPSWFNGASCAAASVCADSGKASTSGGPGAGGSNATSVGTTKNAGGQGGYQSQGGSGAGGGGAGSRNGAGAAGGDADIAGLSPLGGGGGGANGGTAGSPPVTGTSGGVGGNGFGGTGGGTGGEPSGPTEPGNGTAGGGSGGAYPFTGASDGAYSFCGSEFDTTSGGAGLYGAGGGAGGAAAYTFSLGVVTTPGSAFCGGGGGEGGNESDATGGQTSGGFGGRGFVVFTYTHS